MILQWAFKKEITYIFSLTFTGMSQNVFWALKMAANLMPFVLLPVVYFNTFALRPELLEVLFFAATV